MGCGLWAAGVGAGEVQLRSLVQMLWAEKATGQKAGVDGRGGDQVGDDAGCLFV